MLDGTTALENSLAGSGQKLNIELIHDSISNSMYILKKMKTCSHKNLYMNVHTSIIHHKVEDNLTISYKIKHALALWFSNSTARYLSEREKQTGMWILVAAFS